jgi:hypothetical protein
MDTDGGWRRWLPRIAVGLVVAICATFVLLVLLAAT